MMFLITLLGLAPATYATPITLEPASMQTAVIHACSWGDEAPDSPIPLQSPFASGTSVVPGGVGYFYGDGDHSDQINDYYATDWSAKADGSSTNGMAVYAIAEGDIYFIGGDGNWLYGRHQSSPECADDLWTYGQRISILIARWTACHDRYADRQRGQYGGARRLY